MPRLTIRPLVSLFLAFFATTATAQTVAVAFSGGKSITNWHGQADVYAISIETARSLTARTEIGAYVAPQIVWQPRSWYGYRFGNGNEKVQAIGAGGVIRHHRGRFFVELSAGPLWSEKQVPAATSQLNFVTQPGAGIYLTPALFISYRFAHISNGGLSSRNPGWNVSAIAVGWTFPPRALTRKRALGSRLPSPGRRRRR